MALPTTTVILLLATVFCTVLFWRSGENLFLAIGCWLALEAIFAYCLNAKAKRWCATPGVPAMKGHEGLDLMRKVLSQLQFTPDYLTAWFLDADMHHIHLGNLREFMAYGFWYKTYKQLSNADKIIIEAAIQQMEQQTGIFLPEGYNPNIHFMSHLWDALRSSYRPLLFYLGTESVAILTHMILSVCGFKRHNFQDAEFYTLSLDCLQRNAADITSKDTSSSDRKPLLFVHGVGLGLFPYLWLVLKLSRKGHTIIMPHYSHVAMRWTPIIPTVEQCANTAAAFLAHHGIQQVHVMGHSYGTLVCACFAKCYGQLISSLVLLDPVCFCMYMPTLVYTFLYAQRLNFNAGGIFGWLLNRSWTFVQISQELHCAATFCRGFLWSEYNMWPDCLPARTLVALSDGDDLVAPVVKQQLQTLSNALIMHHPTMPHGALLLQPSYMDALIHNWEEMLAEPVAAAKLLQKATGTLANVVAAAEAAVPAAAEVSAVQQAAVADSSWLATAAAVRATAHTVEDDSSSWSSDDAVMVLDQLSSSKTVDPYTELHSASTHPCVRKRLRKQTQPLERLHASDLCRSF